MPSSQSRRDLYSIELFARFRSLETKVMNRLSSLDVTNDLDLRNVRGRFSISVYYATSVNLT